MAAVKSINLLPTIFRSDANKKFLNATVDQFVSEPSFKKVNGYIGRRLAPTFKQADNYVLEPDLLRQNYQLEPSVVVKNNGDVMFQADYVDLLQKIEYYGGIVSNHSRLFENETYSFNGQIDFDKLVNFNRYYWLPAGPQIVDVFSGAVDTEEEFDVTVNLQQDAFNVSGFGSTPNPDVNLVRGGSYVFSVNLPEGEQLWIQTEPGLTGTKAVSPNISTRAILGVTNNGAAQGQVLFSVPESNAQSEFSDMPLLRYVDYGTRIPFNEIHNSLLSVFLEKYRGFDGVSSNIGGKFLIFVSNDANDNNWEEKGAYSQLYDGTYDEGHVIDPTLRTGVWQIVLDTSNDFSTVEPYITTVANSDTVVVEGLAPAASWVGSVISASGLLEGTVITRIIDDSRVEVSSLAITSTSERASVTFLSAIADPSIKLEYVQDIPVRSKVYITSGEENSNTEYFKNDSLLLSRVPLITAPNNTLYYCSSVDTSRIGRIKLIDQDRSTLDVGDDILGRLSYTSPNGVTFTNGLKIKFDNHVEPESYADKVYYVEGVGTEIRLVPDEFLLTPELSNNETTTPFDVYNFDTERFEQSTNGPLVPDYITINRSSRDVNAWSRSNRWFHQDVILETSKYNKTVVNFNQLLRATRPIVEFEPDIKLFNNGYRMDHLVDILDFDITDSLNEVESADPTVPVFGDITVHDGMTVIFAKDQNPEMRNRVFTLRVLNINGALKIHLEEEPDGVLTPMECVAPTAGVNVGRSYWFDGDNWHESQQKTSVNQPPKFDVIDNNGRSLGDHLVYENTTFTGTQIFGYNKGTGVPDSVLGFALKYRTFGNIGDIEFTNFCDVDTFTYLQDSTLVTAPINNGSLIKITPTLDSVTQCNIWSTVANKSRQYQIFSYIYTGVSTQFEIDVVPTVISNSVPSTKVYINNKLVPSSKYEFTRYESIPVLKINEPLVKNDKIDVLVYSKDVSLLGYYQVPLNLDLNTLNKDFSSLTLGQMRNHLTALATDSLLVTGQVPGNSNLRDVRVKEQTGNILQHSAPVLYSSLFLLDKQANFISALDLAQKEYAKFKNKFLEAALSLKDLNIFSPVEGVDSILKTLNKVKNNSFPWYYSDLVPYGDLKNVITYSVLNNAIVEYEISNIFKDHELSNKAVLVYKNGVQLVKDVDYYFNQTRPSVVFNYELEYDDEVTIVEYENTDGCYIPETPSKMGLYFKYVPEKYLDDSYVKPINVIRGHDGSVTPAFNDFRDDILLELERRIYNNIKTTCTTPRDVWSKIPGKFRDPGYSRSEFDQIIARRFLTWVSNAKLDYTSNSYFESNNPWTWNYGKMSDKLTGEQLPGGWRGIYRYFYDTETPNTTPWEMLGFSEKPTWWETHYGPAPYTGGNLVMWEDLEQGLVRDGPCAGLHPEFARPGLRKVVPVTDTGVLKSPADFLLKSFNGTTTSESFAAGDTGPVEAAWKRSSDYPFAIQAAAALMYPAYYFGCLMNLENYSFDQSKNQYVVTNSNKRITPDEVKIVGDTASSGRVFTTGYLNWIRDYLVGLGISDPVRKLKDHLTNASVNLSYKVGGYTDKEYIKFMAEQNSPTSVNESIIIPSENYNIYLHKSPPIGKIAYSAVIVQKTSSGYAVKGYDIENPYFTIVPSEPSSDSYTIRVLESGGTIYNNYRKVKVLIPYGTEFSTRQQVVDFLVSYGRYLQAIGFQFNDFNNDLGYLQDWTLSVREFLTWSQQGWVDGSIVVLSPSGEKVSLVNQYAVVDEIENSPVGSKVLDQNFNIIKKNTFTVLRDGPTFTLTTTLGQTVAYIELNLVQYEHSVIFDNETLFNDIIYKPELGNRQYRLKMVGNKTDNWSGRLESPGFIYSAPLFSSWQPQKDYLRGDLVKHKSNYYVALTNLTASDQFNQFNWALVPEENLRTGLLPNLALNAKKFEFMYDIDNSVVGKEQSAFSNGLIGYRNRDYLEELSLDTSSQVKLYQGFIKEKGTRNSVSALTNAQFNNLTGSLEYYEEWGVRVGEYGALSSNKSLDVILSDSKFTKDPVALSLEASNDQGTVTVGPADFFKSPPTTDFRIFKDRDDNSVYENDIKTAGYVSLEDIDLTIFDISNYVELRSSIGLVGSGFRIWVAKNQQRDWDVYRITETENQTISVKYLETNNAEVAFEFPHELQVNEIFAFRGLGALVDGFYQVTYVSGINTVTVKLVSSVDEIAKAGTISGRAILFKLLSLRFKQTSDIAVNLPLRNWKETDKVWVDNATATNEWGVFKKNIPWTSYDEYNVPVSETQLGTNFGQTVKMSDDARLILIGLPNANGGYGEVKLYFREELNGEYVSTFAQSITPLADGSGQFGKSIDVNARFVVVGSPNSNMGNGQVYLYSVTPTGYLELRQVIAGTLGDKLGTSVSLSRDSSVLYIGAPGNDVVYCYDLISSPPVEVPFSTQAGVMSYPLSVLLDNSGTSVVTDGTLTLLPGTDYYLTEVLVEVNTVFVTVSVVNFHNDPGNNQFTVISGPGFSPSVVPLLTDPLAQPGSAFGYSLKTNNDGSKLVVGAPLTDIHETQFDEDTATWVTIATHDKAGSTYFYTRTGSTTMLTQTLSPRKNNFGAQCGTTVEMSTSGDRVFVSAPYYNEDSYHSGTVQCYVSPTNLYRELWSTVQEESAQYITPGGSIFINKVEVTFTGTTLADAITDILSYNISGVSAVDRDGFLFLTSVTELDVTPGVGAAFAEIGITSLVNVQEIRRPFVDFNTGEQFGTALSYDNEGEVLLVGSAMANTFMPNTFDSDVTVFDNRTTDFFDQVEDSGSAYVYELLHNHIVSYATADQFSFVQQLFDESVSSLGQFGKSMDAANRYILVGSPMDDSSAVNVGRVYGFFNKTGVKGWERIRQKESTADFNYLNRMFLYDSVTQTVVSNLDYIDPVKGKVLGLAEQDIDYKTTFDPAVYTSSTHPDLSSSQDYHWSNFQVGKIWWNLDLVRYVDYEQGSLTYRLANWGRLFPGSTVEVLEWVESDVLPSRYVETVGDGIPKYADDTAYVETYEVNPVTNVIQSKYYFWVKDKKNNTTRGKSRSVSVIADIIANPKAQLLPYAAILNNSSVGLFNYNSLLNGSNVVLRIEYSESLDKDPVHSEFELVQEKNYTTPLPTKIVNKLFDSLTGKDLADRNVPDTRLKPSERYGIDYRPRQSMFVNRYQAVKNLVAFVNDVCSKHPIALEFNIQQLYAKEEMPTALSERWKVKVSNREERDFIDTMSLTPGDVVLVEQDYEFNNLWTLYRLSTQGTYELSGVQGYDTSTLWELVDWYAETFDVTTSPTYTVETEKDIPTLQLIEGDIVHVRNNGAGQFVVYQIREDLTKSIVGLQKGTIRFKADLYNEGTKSVGFDSGFFDDTRYDLDFSKELRFILIALQNNIFVKTLSSEFNRMFFSMMNYVLSEKQFNDWVFKTSFISVVHKLRKLEEFPSYIKDNQDYYLEYINEVKPYRTKVREYLLNYEGLDNAETVVSDFDLPPYYDEDLKRYRSPNFEYARDEEIIKRSEYQDWNSNHSYSIGSVVVANAGGGYSIEPTLTVTGGSGRGAVLRALIDYYAGNIIKVIVENPGEGYTSTPTIVINGTGTGAKLYPVLENSKVRSFNTSLKFDRITYTSAITEWSPTETYNVGVIVSFNNNAYVATSFAAPSEFFNFSKFTLVGANQLLDEYRNTMTAADRAMAYYAPTIGMPDKDLAKLYYGTEFPGVQVEGIRYSDGDDTGYPHDTVNPLLDTIITGDFDPELGLRPEDIDVNGGKFVDRYHSHAPEELIPGRMFDTLEMRVFTNTQMGQTLGYRYFQGLMSEGTVEPTREYYRISNTHTVQLAAPLHITDTEILVSSAATLPAANPEFAIPGVVFINGERITYYGIDLTRNALTQIRRATAGTGAPSVHPVGSYVSDASLNQKFDDGGKIWLNLSGHSGAITDEQGLGFSITEPALFIKAEESYIP